MTGCTKVGPGCDNCYAERFAERFRGVKDHPFEQGFDLMLRPERVQQPLSWRKPLRVFVNSMSDMFHKDVPASFVDQVFDTMEQAHWHQFQLLTKRSSLMRRYINRRYGDAGCPGQIWLGVSVENREKAKRIAHLRDTHAAVRFLSVEPLLGPLGPIDLTGVHWVIVGGESGPGARPMKEAWAIEVRDQCRDQRVPFFFKQWGGIRPKSGGRLLEGREWNEYPQEMQAANVRGVAAE